MICVHVFFVAKVKANLMSYLCLYAECKFSSCCAMAAIAMHAVLLEPTGRLSKGL